MSAHHDQHIEELAIFVHGSLAALHMLGMVHNLRKRNWIDVVAHGLALAYDSWAVSKHLGHLTEAINDQQV